MDDRRKVSHDLTKFLRAEAQMPPEKLLEIKGKEPPKSLCEAYELFWEASMHLPSAERIERLEQAEKKMLLLNDNEVRLKRWVKDLLLTAEYFEKMALNVSQHGQRCEYNFDKTAMLDYQEQAKEYRATALLLRAISWFIFEIYGKPNSRSVVKAE